jgi:16S rRNA (adenine1518-N6/adenine1519-N6)-dimethyltransferase
VSHVRASLERMRRFDVTPNKELGQHFLVDENMLGVIETAAELRRDDIVLEIGGGLGVLSTYLAERVAFVHVIESDAKLQGVLEEALAPFRNTRLQMADIMDLDLSTLTPTPDKVVANLPYGVAVPAILKTIEELSAVKLWCLMVQREIADRLDAPQGTKIYGIPSVLVQLACEVHFERPISRSVFRPRPKVDSGLVVLRRIAPAPDPDVVRIVRGAFAHRRKELGRSLELTGTGNRRSAQGALWQLAHSPNARAEALAPREFAELARRLAGADASEFEPESD